MSATNIDYAATYFEYPELTKIHGAPTYPTIRIIKNEVKANAHSVASNLGGGAHGHYGLVVDPTEYVMVPGTVPYVRPVHPGALDVPINATNHIALGLRADHKEAVRLFRESNDVKQRLIKQIMQSVEPTCMKTLRDVNTHTITCDIPTILNHLFTN